MPWERAGGRNGYIRSPAQGAFGVALRSFRVAMRPRASQSKLAERIGRDHSYIARLESGARMPSRQVVEDLAVAFGLGVEARAELFIAAGFLSDDALAPTPFLLELRAGLDRVPASDRPFVERALLSMVRGAVVE